jgi:type VI secretion system secreted protein VgrG
MGGSVKGATYKNTIQMIRANVPFRPPIPDNRHLLGLFTARVETTGTKYAYLDDQGRYRVRTDFDRGSAAQGEASHPVRMMQPYGGNNYGMHFPLHAKTEVVLACVNGDLDRPVLIGTLSNPTTPSVVTSENNTQNIIRTAGGNELVMDDLLQRQRIELFTADRKNILTLDANAEGHKVRLATEEGEMKIFAKKTLLMESGDTQTVQVGNDHIVTVENAQRLMTRNKEIEFKAATDLLFKARQNIQFQAEKQNIEMTAGKDMIVEVGQNLSMEVREQEMSLLVNNGRLSMEAAKDIVILGRGGGPMTITQGGGTIQISQNGNVVLSAAKIDINGACINLKGTAIGGN